jgi:hypothetical protein
VDDLRYREHAIDHSSALHFVDGPDVPPRTPGRLDGEVEDLSE